jgi:hypothetical protein
MTHKISTQVAFLCYAEGNRHIDMVGWVFLHWKIASKNQDNLSFLAGKKPLGGGNNAPFMRENAPIQGLFPPFPPFCTNLPYTLNNI